MQLVDRVPVHPAVLGLIVAAALVALYVIVQSFAGARILDESRDALVGFAEPVAGFIVATIGNELAVQNWDPQYVRNIVERTEAFGGTFYENGIFNKGLLEPVIHLAAARVTSFGGYWFALCPFY